MARPAHSASLRASLGGQWAQRIGPRQIVSTDCATRVTFADEAIRGVQLGHDDVIAVRSHGTGCPLASSSRNRLIRSAIMKQYVGLDVSQKETSVCVVDDLGHVVF